MLGLIGGTGPEGRGLALRFALAGEKVFIGSRSRERGQQIAQELGQLAPSAFHSISGGTNEEAASRAELVLITTPYEGQKETLEALRPKLTGKIVVNVIAPLSFERGRVTAIHVPEGSAALQAKALLPDSIIVSAFQNMSAEDLLVPDKRVDCDVIVCADDAEARQAVMALAEKIQGVRAVNGGGLANAHYVEELTALLVSINRTYKVHSSIRITGL
ncbi:MAG: NADPH-dependent F420 reductase [Dehalococcoidales bacterium]|nr:NADPH-dependent F420 reductase [Dehalococcoidales bacterium]